MARLAPLSLVLALGSFGCTDYAFTKGGDVAAGDRQDDGPPPDTFAPPEDTADTGIPSDTGTPPTDTSPPADTGTPDGCFEPEDGYTENPAARLVSTDGTAWVTITFVASDTDYDDALWMDAPESVLLAQPWQDPVGTAVNLGPYAAGTELVFGIRVRDTGDHWQSGPGSRNSDGVVHGAVTYEGGCSWLIGFEDLAGGGDRDYNDVILRVQGMLRQDQ